MKIILNNYKELDKEVAYVEYWYDRRSRNWVIQQKNKDNCQLGDSIYEYDKDIAKKEAELLAEKHNVKAIKTVIK